MNSYNDYFQNQIQDQKDPLQNELARIKLERQRFGDIESIFDQIRKTYLRSSIPNDKNILSELVSQNQAPSKIVNKELIIGNLKYLSNYLMDKMKMIHEKNLQKSITSFFEVQKPKTIIPLKTGVGRRPMSSNKADLWGKLHNSKLQKNLPFREKKNLINYIKPKRAYLKDQQNFQEFKELSSLNKNTSLRGANENSSLFSESNQSSKHTKGHINININSVPNNSNNFINIYNQPNSSLSKKHLLKNKLMNQNIKKQKRPLSAMAFKNKTRSNSKLNTSFTRNIFKPFSPIISLYKTNMLSKNSLNLSTYDSKLILNNRTNITCLEVDIIQNLIFIGNAEGVLGKYEVDLERKKTNKVKEINLNSKILRINQFTSTELLVIVEDISKQMFLIGIDGLRVVNQFKTYRETIKLICSFNSDKFLAITHGDKSFLYQNSKSVPLKSFRFKTKKIIDALMPSSQMMFTATNLGEIRIFKI